MWPYFPASCSTLSLPGEIEAVHSHTMNTASFSKDHQAQHWALVNSTVHSVLSSRLTIRYPVYICSQPSPPRHTQLGSLPSGSIRATLLPSTNSPLVVACVASAPNECCFSCFEVSLVSSQYPLPVLWMLGRQPWHAIDTQLANQERHPEVAFRIYWRWEGKQSLFL